MKAAIAIVMLVSSMVMLGCESPQGGGMSGKEGFTIVTPTFDTKIKQGETESVTISLNRGDSFKRDVTLEIKMLDNKSSKGVSVEPTTALVKGNEKPDVHLTIKVAKDANLGEYTIFLKGTPETGKATSTQFTVKVVSP